MNILITGGASGLGKAFTEQLAKTAGNKVYFTFNNSADSAQQIEQKYQNTSAIQCNFGDSDSVENLLRNLENIPIDVLINNALTGIETNHFHKLPPHFFVENFTKNILPVISITQNILLKFRKQKSGKIITVLSNYILDSPPIGLSEYVAQKNYLLSLTKSWAVENVKFNISSMAVSPSFMQTGLTKDTDERVIEEMIRNSDDKKLLTPAEVASVIQKMINTDGLTGKNIVINTPSDIKHLHFD